MKPAFCLYCGFWCKDYATLREWEVPRTVLPEATIRCRFCLRPLIGLESVRSEKYMSVDVSLHFESLVAQYFRHGCRTGTSENSELLWLTQHAEHSFAMLLNCLRLDDERRTNDQEMRARSYFGHGIRAFAARALIHLHSTSDMIPKTGFSVNALPLLRKVRQHEYELSNVFAANDVSNDFDPSIEVFTNEDQ